MTGALKRWEKRPKAWSETWQCLHFTGPTKITAELAAGGRRDRAARRRSGRTACSTATRAAAPHPAQVPDRARVGPRPAVVPPVPGLRRAGDDVRHAQLALRRAHAGARPRRPGRARRARSPRRGSPTTPSARRSVARRISCVARLDPDDDRAALVKAAIGGRKPDLTQLAALLEETPSYTEDLTLLRRLSGLALPSDEQIRDAFQDLKGAEREHADASATDAARATSPRHAAAPGARGPRRRGLPGVQDAGRAGRRVGEGRHGGSRAAGRAGDGAHAGQRASSRSRAAAWSRCSTATRSPPRRPRSISASPRSSSSNAATRRRPRRRWASCASSPRRRPPSSSARARPGRSSPATCAAGSPRPRRWRRGRSR